MVCVRRHLKDHLFPTDLPWTRTLSTKSCCYVFVQDTYPLYQYLLCIQKYQFLTSLDHIGCGWAILWNSCHAVSTDDYSSWLHVEGLHVGLRILYKPSHNRNRFLSSPCFLFFLDMAIFFTHSQEKEIPWDYPVPSFSVMCVVLHVTSWLSLLLW